MKRDGVSRPAWRSELEASGGDSVLHAFDEALDSLNALLSGRCALLDYCRRYAFDARHGGLLPRRPRAALLGG